MEYNVTVTLSRYDELLKAEEKLAVIERMLVNQKYVSTGDIEIVLGIGINKPANED